jgi:trigger factor
MADEELAIEQEQDQAEAGGAEGEEQSADEKFMARLKEAVEVTKEDLGGLRLRLTVTVPREVLDDRLHEQFAELRREAAIPGFRKGHAPLKLVEKRFASDVGEELKGKLVGSGYLAAVEKLDIKPLGDPFIWVKAKEDRVGEDQRSRTVEVDKLVSFDKALDHLDLPKDGPLRFRCEVELTPQFELPKLEGIPIEKPKITIDEDDVEQEVNRLLRWHGTFQPVEGGEIERDDLLYASMKMIVEGDVIASDENYELAARDLRIQGVRLTGLGDAMIEHKVGDTVAIEGTVPDDHAQIDLRGKKARFEFVIQEIKRWTLQELDEKLLEAIGYESKERLHADIRGRLELELDQILARRMKEQVGAYLVKETNIEIPSGLSQRQTERSVARRMIQMYQEGMPQADIDKKMDELRSSAHDQVLHDLKLYFILDKIATDREVEVADEEMNGAIAQIAQRTNKRFDRVRDELARGDGMMSLYMRLRDEKVLSSLVETAEVKEVEGPKKTRAKKAPKKADA